MAKRFHEIRDPIHNFITLSPKERELLNTWPFQRLRYINQLATTYMVYPGATYKRFEHSLGVMHLAGMVFDVLIQEDHLLTEYVKDKFANEIHEDKETLRRTVRLAALCHDLGHLPFSHGAEILLEKGITHEHITKKIILEELHTNLLQMNVIPQKVAKLAVGPEIYKEEGFTEVELILSEIITGDAFGVDRIDYLLRDSYHTGVAYGKFDHYRLIDSLRILDFEEDDSKAKKLALGLDEDGIHAAEALGLARYYMFSLQLYYHPN